MILPENRSLTQIFGISWESEHLFVLAIHEVINYSNMNLDKLPEPCDLCYILTHI